MKQHRVWERKQDMSGGPETADNTRVALRLGGMAGVSPMINSVFSKLTTTLVDSPGDNLIFFGNTLGHANMCGFDWCW